MAGIIRFDYNKAMRQVNEMKEIARDMRNLSNQSMETILKEIRGAWSGDAANVFGNKYQELRNNILTEAKNIETVAENLKNAAEQVRRAEEEAIRILQTQGGGSK